MNVVLLSKFFNVLREKEKRGKVCVNMCAKDREERAREEGI